MAHRVVFVVFPDMQALDLVGPLEIFSMANRFHDEPRYLTEIVGSRPGVIRTSSGLDITAHGTISTCTGPVDTLVVVGGPGVISAVEDNELVAWIQATAHRSRRVTSVCSGAFLLAQAGILGGRRATTHWAACAQLAAMYPDVTVDADPIFVRDGNVWTSAGVTAGMDLALALIEEDLGPKLAREVAQFLVLFVQRSGGQAQFSTQLAAQRPDRDSFTQLQSWIADHLHEDLSVTTLAKRTCMSTRNFSRRFTEEFAMTPAAYVEAVRVEAARRLLESTQRPVPDIAQACGFGTVETMYRSFKRTVAVAPSKYRHQFSTQNLA
ncbi:GlxA family transcriptional regulator [Nocardia asteroides]|uniref:GlxA family transcriptional regulator n=1 Tax=Nocardia asteroides TaxID=1824 RepID=UPI0037C72F3F